jgi:hypothetical protein
MGISGESGLRDLNFRHTECRGPLNIFAQVFLLWVWFRPRFLEQIQFCPRLSRHVAAQVRRDAMTERIAGRAVKRHSPGSVASRRHNGNEQ